MNLQPMSSGGCDASGREIRVYCIKCLAAVGGKEALCDLDGQPGSYWCPSCAEKSKNIDRFFDRMLGSGGATLVGGTEPGDACGRDGCEGIIRENEVENCSCHISPPCHRCVTVGVSCDTCDYDTRGES